MLRIRETRHDDFAAIRDLLLAENLGGEWFTQERFDRMLKKNRELFIVAEKECEVVGTIFASYDGGYFGYLYKIAVAPQHRRQGIGSMLVERTLEKFNLLGIEWHFANVHTNNDASLRLLAKFGLTTNTAYPMVDNDPR